MEIRLSLIHIYLATLYRCSDVISVHLPSNSGTFHLLDQEAFSQMKDGVIIINTARGNLIDSRAFIQAVKTGKIGGAGLDLLEDENGIYYHNRCGEVINNDELSIDVYKRQVGSRRWQIATDPKMRKMITDERGIPKLKESFIDALKKGDYAKAFTNYATTTDFLVNYYAKEGEAYDPSKEFSGGALAGGGAIALGIAALIRKVLMGQMSNVQPASDASAYLNKESFGLTGSNDTYLYTTTAVIPKKKENSGGSSSGGSSGGNGGGGGSF